MTSSMSILPATPASPSATNGQSIALEIAAPTPLATHVSVKPADTWAKTNRRKLIIIGVTSLTAVLLTAGLLYYFLSYVPTHTNSGPVYNQKEFQLWMANHGVSYSSQNAQDAAFANWLANLQIVHQANLASADVKYNLGPYADLTQEQYQSKILTLSLVGRTTSPTTAPPTTVAPGSSATTLNWATNSGMVSPVKNQGQCGDCWAFSAAEAFEVAYNVAYQPSSSIVLSPQQITSCDTKYGDQGCNGGDPANVFQNYLGTGSGKALTTEANYPFTSGNSGASGTCNTAAEATGFVQLTSWSYAVAQTSTWSQSAEDQLIASLQTGPVSICIDASPWQNYAGGVLSNTAGGCTASTSDIDHAVQLVGYTATYWIVKNQWGTSWGDKGYIYLARGANTCCILCEATQITAKSTQSGVTTAPPTTKTTTTTTKAAATTTVATPVATTASGATTAAGGTTARASTTTTKATTTTKKATTTTTQPDDPYWWYYEIINGGKW